MDLSPKPPSNGTQGAEARHSETSVAGDRSLHHLASLPTIGLNDLHQNFGDTSQTAKKHPLDVLSVQVGDSIQQRPPAAPREARL